MKNFSTTVIVQLNRILFLAFVICGTVLSVFPQNEKITIDYSKIVDRSSYTHSGQSVGEILDDLNSRRGIFDRIIIDNTDLENFDAEKVLAEANQELQKISKQVKQGKISMGRAYLLSLSPKMRRDSINGIVEEKNIQSLIEPFLEPYAFLLQDALESVNPTQLNNPLIEVADLFPSGEKQPAWANILKTRRFFALSDGKGYVRIFLPGKMSSQGNLSAQETYNKNYGAVRHILNWLRESTPSKELNVDVYAYENNMSSQVLNLGKVPLNLKITQNLDAPKNSIALDLDSIKDFLAKGLTLEGAYINDEGTLVLYGSKSATPPTLEGHSLELSDFAAAYRAVFYSGYNEPYISLDSSPFPEQVNVNFGGRLADTRIGWVTLRSDMRFKTLSVGLDPVTDENQTEQIRKTLPDFKTRIERMMSTPAGSQTTSEGTRFWFYPDRGQGDTVGGVETSVSRDTKFFKIKSPRFIGKAERQSASIGERQLENITPIWTKATLAHLNKNYDVFSKKFPELNELDNVGRLLSLFSWLKTKQKAGVMIDFDSFLNVELPESKTPRRKAQLVAGLFVRNNVIQKVFNYSSLAQEIADEREIDNKNPFLPSDKVEFRQLVGLQSVGDLPEDRIESDKFLTFIGGGIDLSLKGVVNKARKLTAPEEIIYTRIKQSTPDVGILEKPGKRVFKAEVRKPIDIPPQPNPPLKPHIISEAIEVTPSVKRKSISGEKSEVVEYKLTNEKVKWTRNSMQNSFDNQKSKTAFFGNDGTVETIARVEDGKQIAYKLSKSGDKLIAENSVLSKENEVAFIDGLRQKGDSDLEIWRSLPETTDIIAFEKMADGKLAVLRGTEDDIRLTLHDAENKVTKTFEGDAAIKEIEKATTTKLETASNDEVSFVHATFENDNFVLLVGKEQKQFSIEELTNIIFDRSSESAKTFDAIFEGQKDFIVYRDALTRRAEQLGGSLRTGMDSPTKMVALLRERFPNKRIYLDDEIDVAKQNRKAIALLTRPSDVGMLAPEESFPIKDHGLIKNIKRDWKSSGGVILENVLAQPEAMRKLPNVLLLSGHNDANLTSYLINLGEAGLLESKVVFLQTCYTAENPGLNNHLIQKYKPKAIFVHTEKISPVALESVLTNFASLLKNAETNNKPIHPLDLMEESIKLSLGDEDITPFIKDQIEKLRRGTFQISWINKAKKQQSKQAE